ncbi:hypothetical protein J8F10_35460 [Gemmata sp. G18]|uniref:HEAT repeat domain-containing protein n=1 Tax=Gemmata palustris TaxID=2822762 RepID=A0ABS5C623_9BACT|nr:hypothetical protein [Gemmata palustris]MBP3960553.1 hypothetical protein [Gemmata palustris]
MLLRCLVPTALAAVVCLSFTPPVSACPGCGPPSGQTLTMEVAQADFILYGTLGNAKPDPKDPGSTKGTTDITIDSIVKEHALVKDKKVFTIPRFVPPDPKPFKYMVFFNVVNGDVDPYRGVVVGTDSKLPEYVKGALAVKQKDTATRLRYFFDYLESNEIEISGDAYNEFAVATYQEVSELAPKLPPETLLKWLKDPNTRASRLGLYGLLVGHSGKPEYAKEIRALMDAPENKFSSGLDGLLMGYILLDKKNGYEYLTKLIADKDKEFLVKHSGLKALRFFWEYRSDVLTRQQVLDGMGVLLDHPDLADMPIDDLRKWKAWEMSPAVLKLADKETHNTLPINNRAILKFALAASWADPKNAAAAAHVEKARKDNPERVKLVEDLLKDEVKVAPKAPEPPKK